MSVYIDNLETEFLPLNCNWITSNLLPKYDENNNLLSNLIYQTIKLELFILQLEFGKMVKT